MEMERTPLTQAHDVGRAALRALKQGLTEECIQLHLTASELLREIKDRVDDDNLCRRAIEQQQLFHQKQAELVQVLRDSVARGIIKMEQDTATAAAQNRNRRVLKTNSSQNVNLQMPNANFMGQFEETDSLMIQIFGRRGSQVKEMKDEGEVHIIRSGADGETLRAVEFMVKPKKDDEIIEELKTVNTNLRALVDQLMNELALVHQQNAELKTRLAKYEGPDATNTSTTTAELGPAAGGPGNPKEFGGTSTTSRLQGAINTVSTMDEIPELEPLEYPDFDEENFKSFAP